MQKWSPMVRCVALLVCLFAFLTPLTAQTNSAKKLDPGARTFTVSDAAPGKSLLTVPFYFAPGETSKVAAFEGISGGNRIALQAKVLSRHPGDGTARAVLLRGIAGGLKKGQSFMLTPIAAKGKPLLTVTGKRAEFAAGPRRVVLENGVLSVQRGGVAETAISPLAPHFPQGYYGPEIHVLENGPVFSWIQCTYKGWPWNVTLDIQADASGQVELVTRILAVQGKQQFPTFGFGATVPNGERKINGLADNSTSFVLRDEKRRVENWTEGATQFVFPDGAYIRQGRLEISGGRSQLFRDPKLDNLDKKDYAFQEGQERSVKLALAAPSQATLNLSRGLVSGQRRAAVVMQSAPTDWGDLTSMRAVNSALVPKLQCLDGDEWGDVTVSVNRDEPVYHPNSLTRLDIGESWLEDYYLGGSPVLRDVAVRWAENYLERALYRGWDLNAFGGERYVIVAEEAISNFNLKGLFLLIHAYEETGDERYHEAAIAAADRVVNLMRTQAFLPSYDLKGRFSVGNNTRTAYFAVDLVKFFQYTGDEKYLRAAEKIIGNLELMRERTGSSPDLTTNYHLGEKIEPLLSEGASDPYSLGWLAMRGNDIGTAISPGGFPKPFILDYHLRGANAVCGASHDPAAKMLLQATADRFATKRNLLGFWSYPQTNSPFSTIFLSPLIGGSLLHAYEVTGDKRYLDVAIEQIKFLVQLHHVTGDFTFDFKMGAGNPFFYGADTTSSDVRRGQLTTGYLSRDSSGHFFDLMNTYFRLFPAQTARLKAPLQNALARWVVEKAPLAGHAERKADPIAADFTAALALEPMQGFEEGLSNSDFTPEIGNCYLYRLRNESPSDFDGKSTLRLFENGKELGPGHALHSNIRKLGQGFWSHWGGYGERVVMFSSSDNSDPRSNGRTYTVRQEPSGDAAKAVTAWEEFLKKYPDSPFTYWRLANLLEGTPRAGEYLEKFVSAFPRHPRSGTARLRLYRLTGDVQWLKETVRALPGSVWAREAAALLWARGLGTRPPLVLANDGIPIKDFRENRTLQTAAHRTEITAQRDGDALLLHVIGYDWPQGPAGTSSLSLYFDVREDHERWIKFEVDPDSGQRRFHPGSWPGIPVSPLTNEADWSAKQTRQNDTLTFDIRIPLAKLGISATNTSPTLLGFDVVRQQPEEWSFWSHTMNSYNVFTGDFGRLLLK